MANVELLRRDGVTIVGPAAGYLAEGDQGPGRMVEPADLVAAVTAFVSVKWLVGYVSRNGLGVFAWYRIALGGVILATLALK